MLRIDAHQHFWQYNPVRDSWITDDMGTIQRDFLPPDLYPLLQQQGIDGCVAVQADQSEEETDFLLRLAEKHAFIKGVVGWVDLRSPDLEERLIQYKKYAKLVGFRHVLQGEAQRDLMLREDFVRGIALLGKHQFTYDILIHADQLKFVPAFVEKFPAQRFVLDHLAKPLIKQREVEQWRKEMRQVALFPNVYCKISGMVTEASWNTWTAKDFRPYLDVVVDSFGQERIMFGSDWPVCLVAASYHQMIKIVNDYFAQFNEQTRALFFGNNAVRFYKLN